MTSAYSAVDIVCFYADLGRPYYPLIKRMTDSAKACLPNAKLILLSPNAPENIANCFDHLYAMPNEAREETICLERARSIVSWMRSAQNKTLFVDPDIEFRKEPELDGDYDIGLLWRKSKADQPVNTGAIIANPGHFEFWKHYAKIVANLPSILHSWFCDQLAFSLLTGVCHKAGETLELDGARVRLLAAEDHCYTPEKVTPHAWAVHHKGARKGEGWDKIFGNSSPAQVLL